MELDTIQDAISRSTSRRSIVRTGVRMAYTAPLVAASTQLHTAGAAAVSDAPIPGGLRVCTCIDGTVQTPCDHPCDVPVRATCDALCANHGSWAHFGVPTNGLRRHIDASQQTGRSGPRSDVVVVGNHSPPLRIGPIGRAGGHTMRPTGRPRHAGAPFMQRACG
jgi:hypothetical protein